MSKGPNSIGLREANLPPSWKIRPLEKCGVLLSGGTPSKANEAFWRGDLPWFSSKEVTGFELHDSELHVSPLGAERGASLIPSGTVLFVVRGMSLAKEFRVGVTMRQATFNQDVKALVPADDVDGRYLARCLHWLEPHVLAVTEESSHGTKRLPSHAFATLGIPLPPLAQQRRIAAILDKADAVRRKRREAIGLTEELLRAAFLEMFGDPVTNPKGWPRTTLGAASRSMQYGTSQKCEAEAVSGAFPVLRIPNVARGRINQDELKYAVIPAQEALSLQLGPGDMLFVRSNGNPEYIARCAVFTDGPKQLFASYLIRVQLSSASNLSPLFVQAQLSMPSYRAVLQSEARTTAGNYNISTEGLRRLALISPPPALQERYVAFRLRVERHVSRLGGASAEADAAFASLLHRAFRGEL
jgi:type I restriction enzyme, S subunit